MKGATVDVRYLSAGANRHTAVADWSEDEGEDGGRGGIVAFGADCNVALWRPNDATPRGITHLLSGHKGAVKAVKFLPRQQQQQQQQPVRADEDQGDDGRAGSESESEPRVSYLLSGADDQCLKVWRLLLSDDGACSEVECIQTVQSHTAAVNCIATLGSGSRSRRGMKKKKKKRWIFATGAADASIKVWSFDGGSGDGEAEEKGAPLVLLQTIKPSPKFFPLALALSELDDGSSSDGGGGPLVLAAAGTRDFVQIYVADSDPSSSSSSPGAAGPGEGEHFRLQATLSGHEGWIRSLDFAREEGEDEGGDLILASASQDKYIRLWRFHAGTELPPAAAAATADPSADPTSIMGGRAGGAAGRSPSNKAHRLKTATDGSSSSSSGDYSITFEALLLGHDDWIYSAKWRRRRRRPSSSGSGSSAAAAGGQEPLQLLSASADNTLAVWEADGASGIWVTTARLGEISREKGATTATGSAGGFWAGLWAPDGRSVACLGRTGSWRVWGYDRAEGRWLPRVGITGHTRAVTGIAWSGGGGVGGGGGGDYLLSTSADQTTRLHASWASGGTEGEEEKKPEKKQKKTWHEMARPQIHGYDLNCIDSLGPTQFVSGADEKLMRVFDEPGAVARLLRRVCGISSGGDGDGDGDGSARPDAADMPVLGLSNKAVVDLDEDKDNGAALTTTTSSGKQKQNGFVDIRQQLRDGITEPQAEAPRKATNNAAAVPTSTLDRLAAGPPPEDALSRHTLWPEAEKLYGHGYEVSCLAGSHDGGLVASACRASSANHAVIRVFATAPRWAEAARPPLAAHSLTVARLRFSPRRDRYLLSVGRDRVWAVFEREGGGEGEGEGEGEGGDGAEQGEEEEQEAEAEGAERDGGAPVHAAANDGEAAAKKLNGRKKSGGSKRRGPPNYKLLQSNPKGHSRMILDAAWAPAPLAEAQLVFATAGRDKQVKIWRRQDPVAEDNNNNNSAPAQIACAAAIPEAHPVTAVDFLPRTVTASGRGGEGEGEGRLVLAVGTEAGKVSLYALDAATLQVSSSLTLRPELCLAKAVQQLSWRPQRAEDGGDELAIAGEDGTLRIYSFANLDG